MKPSVTFTRFPREILGQVITTEDQHAERLKEWAYRFQTFDEGTSQLLMALATEGKQRKHKFTKIARQVFGQEYPLSRRICTPTDPLEGTALAVHFFVFNWQMTRVVFTAALQMKTESQLFYEHCRVSVHSPWLRAFFESLANDDKAHIALLEEALERLTLQEAYLLVGGGCRSYRAKVTICPGI